MINKRQLHTRFVIWKITGFDAADFYKISEVRASCPEGGILFFVNNDPQGAFDLDFYVLRNYFTYQTM